MRRDARELVAGCYDARGGNLVQVVRAVHEVVRGGRLGVFARGSNAVRAEPDRRQPGVREVLFVCGVVEALSIYILSICITGGGGSTYVGDDMLKLEIDAVVLFGGV